ncbi:MAG: DUF1800 domain-containing protein [Vicinamibacteria bacterium]|nr:DUF1800 domain-containing protein [Vicinamibacteria bacterium]
MPDPEGLGYRTALHLLGRVGFGPRPGELRTALEGGLEKWARQQLEPGPDPELDARLSAFTTLGYSTSRVLQLNAADPRTTGVVLDEMASAKVIRAVHGRNQLVENMVDFWFNHFNVFVNDGFDRYAILSYERDAIRPHVLGRFRDLLGSATKHPAMLFYLDNYLNSVPRGTGLRQGGINENHGRELLELHTVGVDAGYSQNDVVEAARVLTGHGIDNITTGGNYQYRATNHDPGAKQVFGHAVAAGGGAEELEGLLDYLASHPATARFISWRLAQRFVADNPPAALVDRLAEVYLAEDGNLTAVMRALIGSAPFWAEAYGAGKPRKPFEYAITALRAVGANVTNTRGVRAFLTEAGEPLYACNPPTGYTNNGLDWLNPSAQLARMNFALDLTSGVMAGVTVNLGALISSGGGDPNNPRSVADAVNREAFGLTLAESSLATASRVATGGPVSVAARVTGLLIAGPEMQVR